jgi:hypothetical protein
VYYNIKYGKRAITPEENELRITWSFLIKTNFVKSIES